jgi:hypothetical protein
MIQKSFSLLQVFVFFSQLILQVFISTLLMWTCLGKLLIQTWYFLIFLNNVHRLKLLNLSHQNGVILLQLLILVFIVLQLALTLLEVVGSGLDFSLECLFLLV